jgi:HSP20 family protein
VIPLPGTVNEEKIEAEYKAGVLKVFVPKTEAVKPRHIEVKA